MAERVRVPAAPVSGLQTRLVQGCAGRGAMRCCRRGADRAVAPAQDREEQTMELSLFAEAFSEMLARDYGEVILAALYHERRAPLLSRFCLVSRCSAGVPPPAAAAAPARARSRTFCSFEGRPRSDL